jgi:hypothetical protein
VLERLARLDFDILAGDHREPAQLAWFGRVRMLSVEPRRPVADHPFAIGRGWRIARADDPAALRGDGRTVPADQEAVLRFEEVRQLVKGFEVVRAALVLGDIGRVLGRAHLNDAAVAQAPDAIGAVELTVFGEEFAGSVDHTLELRVLAAEDQAAVVCGRGQAEDEVGFPAARRTAEEELIGFTQPCFRLWAR